MNILLVDQYSALGGAQQCMVDLLPAFREQGWNLRAAIPPGGPLVKLLRDQGIPVEEIRCGPYDSGKKSAKDVLQFAADVPIQSAAISRLLDSVDLLYVNGPRLLVAATSASRGRVPILFHAHHSIEQGSAAYVEGMALRRSKAMVAACCDAVARPLRTWVAPESIVTIPNGTADFGFQERSFDKARIGIIGRIAPDKGQVLFLRAAKNVLERYPDARFVICGSSMFGDRAYYQEVLNLASNLPVEFLDWQDNVGAVMRDLDILVIPSRREGMPRVILEAFSAGLPVVAFPVGGIPEVITDGETGFLTTDLAVALCDVLASPLMSTIARNARRTWEQRYTLDAYRKGITDLIKTTVSR